MVDFIKIPKKRPFSERLAMVAKLLNDNGHVSVENLVFHWGVSPHYAMTILKWAAKKYSYAEWDPAEQCLFIQGRQEG